MFDFFNDLFFECEKGAFRYQVCNGKQIVVEGYKSILLVNENQIILKTTKGELEIEGEQLKIKEFGTNTFVATGKIFAVKTGGEK